MAITRVRGTFHNMPVFFHQDAGQTVRITPGNFCPACHDSAYLDVDEGWRECRNCSRCYYLPSQRAIDAAAQKDALEDKAQVSSAPGSTDGD